ncbi:MAG: hypothetical protein Q7T24_02330, partial [Deltaproteobacteria bacterium]|nr:hypothetical protein [Deltaproteobacteria bacterium]
GARSLKRLLQREVQDALAMKFLEGEFKEGETMAIDCEDGKLTFKKSAPATVGEAEEKLTFR